MDMLAGCRLAGCSYTLSAAS